MPSITAFLPVVVARSAATVFTGANSCHSLKRRPRTPPDSKSIPTFPKSATRHPPSATLIPANAPPPTEDALSAFASAVSGEWRGYEGRFDATTGAVLPVPDYYIPEQFTEWGIVPHGFESNHSVIVRDTRLFRKFFRILPTVSLFADHVDLEEDFVVVPLHSDGDDVKPVATAIFPEGSFISGPSSVPPKRESRLDKWPKIMFSVRDPREGEQRVANVWMSFNFEKAVFVEDVRAVVEKWSCQYCDGADIEGSSGFVDGWVSGAAGSPDALCGRWAVSSDGGAVVAERGDTEAAAHVVVRDAEDNGVGALASASTLFLPDGLDISVRWESGEDNRAMALVVQVGWLVDSDVRIVLRRSFLSDGAVASSQRVVERRLS